MIRMNGKYQRMERVYTLIVTRNHDDDANECGIYYERRLFYILFLPLPSFSSLWTRFILFYFYFLIFVSHAGRCYFDMVELFIIITATKKNIYIHIYEIALTISKEREDTIAFLWLVWPTCAIVIIIIIVIIMIYGVSCISMIIIISCLVWFLYLKIFTNC